MNTRSRLIRLSAMSVFVAAAVWLPMLAAVGAQGQTQRIWEGVFTTAQAERGKAVYMTTCIRCHGADLSGTTAPPLTGERFMDVWGGESVDRLFIKIRDTMPPTFGTILDEGANLDIVAFILQTGGYPAGPRELSLKEELSGIRIVRKGEQAAIQNFSLVETVGCLARGPNNSWLLTSTADPTATREDAPPPDAAAAAGSKPLGANTFLLLSVKPFQPETLVGRKVEARGLVYRSPGDDRLTLTSLTPIGA